MEDEVLRSFSCPATTRRRFIYGATSLLLFGVTGCRDGGSNTDVSSGDARTIEHRLGTTEVSGQPERVAALDYISADLATAVGVQPVAINVYLAYEPGEVSPWIGEEINAGEVEFIDIANSVPFEQIAALDPDVILATYTGITESDYESLSQIAPTVAYQSGPFADAWQGITRAAGTALGRNEAAEQLINETETEIESVVEGNPSFEGKTFTVSNVFAGDQVGVLFKEEDPTIRLLTAIGFEPSPNLGEVASIVSGENSGFLSLERLDLLESDILFINYLTPEAQEELEGNDLFQRLDVVQRGSVVTFEPDEWNGFRAPSVLSIPFVLDAITPKIQAALGESATEATEGE